MGPYVTKCLVCEDVLRNNLANYCRRCGNILSKVEAGRGKNDATPYVQAMRKGWDKEDECFKCHYSGIQLNDDDPRDPRYITFDHTALEKGAEMVVTAALIDEMKANLSEDEFKTVITQLAQHFNDSSPVDVSIFNIKHY